MHHGVDTRSSTHKMIPMRTTLDIDPVVLSAAREVATHTRRNLGEVISEWARRGIELSGSTHKSLNRNGFPLFSVPGGTPPVTSEKVRQLLADEDLPA
jgi:hypothetical protein